MTTPAPTLILRAAPRLTLRTPIRDTRPIDQYAALFLGFDFGPSLDPSVTLSDPLINCSVYRGTDASPGDRVLGGAALAPSILTGATDQMVVQLVGLMVGGVSYRIQCYVTGSDGATYDLWGIVPCCAVPVAPVVHGVPLVDALGNDLVDADGNPIVS